MVVCTGHTEVFKLTPPLCLLCSALPCPDCVALHAGTFAVADQIDLAAACATAAGCIDLLAMGMSVAWVWAALNMSSSGLATPEVVPLLMFACNCWQHGVASVAVMQTVGSLEQQDEE